ncbi:MAG: hypothetical protein ACYDIC_13740 [Desulfobaccales bacterium]
MTKTFRPEFMHATAFPHCFGRISGWWVIIFLLLWLGASPVSAVDAPFVLKTAVILTGANSANDALSISIQPGAHELDLYLQADNALKQPLQGNLIITKFLAQTTPGDVVAATMRLAGASSSAGEDVPLKVSFNASDVLRVTLAGGAFRPGTTYKGSLFLTAGGQTNRWEITLTTGGRGILAVSAIGTLKFSMFPWLSWFPVCGGSMGDLPITLYDKSEGGPYNHVKVRFEPAGNPASKAISSNFNLNSFSFYEMKNCIPQPIDLEGCQHLTKITIPYRGQCKFDAWVKPLSPGEYTGALRFTADESSDDATDAKLPLTIQVRHCWVLPVLVILFGSLGGWYSSKYIIAFRKARDLARQVNDLRARADNLARPDPPLDGWEFPGESTSYGLARVRVQLSQLAQLTSSAFPILIREEELKQRLQDAVLRVSALERLHSVRTHVQKVADGRPAAQWALEQLLREANDLLEGPTFDPTQKAAFENLLNAAEAWEKEFDAKYREALANRLISHEIPTPNEVKDSPKGDVQEQLEVLLEKFCPTKAQIMDPSTNPNTLKDYDHTIAKIALLWRDQRNEWSADLVKACSKGGIEDLFRLVDSRLWDALKKNVEADPQLHIVPEATSQGFLKTYDLMVVRLTSNIQNISDERILIHPLRVMWHIDPPDHNIRSMENHGLTMVQYFPQPGPVKITADLQWQGDKIPLKDEMKLEVERKEELDKHPLLGGGLPEWTVFAIAAGFAIATAMNTLYDSTFGSFNQYLALFLWAAGAGTGGNIFKQLGSTSAPGGQADVSLPTVAAGGGATAGK